MIERLERFVGAPVALEELKHKPGRRRTLRARGPKGTAIVKAYESERAPVVARRLESLASGPKEPAIPTVLAVYPDLRVVVLSDVPGRPLREALLTGDVATCARAGFALGGWHAAWRGVAPGVLEPQTAEREVALLRARAETASPAVACAVAEALPEEIEEWDCATVVHRDLYEEHVLVGGRVGLIDLDDAATGPPELDVGNLIAHVELLELRRSRDLTRGKQALLDAYARAGTELDEALLDRCRRLTLLRLACLNDDASLVDAALAERVGAAA